MDEHRYRMAEAALWAHWGLAPRERWVQHGTSGPRLRVLELGDPSGAPVLFVHGGMVAGSCWVDLASRLVDHRLLLLDRPGCGLSEPLRPPLSPPDLPAVADDLLADVLARLGIDRAHAVTNSFGGYFALRTAISHADRIASITEFGWCPGAPPHRLPLLLRVATHRALAPIASRVPATRTSVTSMLRATGLGEAIDHGRIPPAGIDWNVALQNHTATRRHEFRLGKDLQHTIGVLAIPDADLGRITAPVRIVLGTDDPFGTVPTMRAMADAIPDGTLEVWPGAGHAAWLDDLDRAAATVRDVLAAA